VLDVDTYTIYLLYTCVYRYFINIQYSNTWVLISQFFSEKIAKFCVCDIDEDILSNIYFKKCFRGPMQVWGGGDVDEAWLYLSQARTVTSKGVGRNIPRYGPWIFLFCNEKQTPNKIGKFSICFKYTK
jgi:hypothetical protein